MISWLKKLPLFKQVYRQGGIDSFALAQKDILETMRDDLDSQAEALAQTKLNNFLSPIDLNSLIGLDKKHGIIFIGGVMASDVQLSNLRSEAEAFKQFSLYKLLMETPKQLAHNAMFTDDGKLQDLLIKGRVILYTLDAQKNIIDTLTSFVPKKK